MTVSAHLIAASIALARMTMPHADVEPIARCLSEVAHVPVPATLPMVVRVETWTLPAEGRCCNANGETSTRARPMTSIDAFGHTTQRYVPLTAKAKYYWGPRMILLAQSADDSQLVHEMYADFASQALGRAATVAEREAIDTRAYHFEKLWPFVKCRADLPERTIE